MRILSRQGPYILMDTFEYTSGGLTNAPQKVCSRERLCLRGTTDYWVNDAIGRPFFVVEKAIDPGMLKTLEKDIVPRLLKDIPGQPNESELKANPARCRLFWF